MSSFNLSCTGKNQVTISSLNDYQIKLNALSKSKACSGLVVTEKGTLAEASPLALLWEKFKGMLGYVDHSSKKLVAFHSLRLIERGVDEAAFNSPEQTQSIIQFAMRAGLISKSVNYTIINTASLTQTIAKYLLQSDFDGQIHELIERFYTENKRSIEPVYYLLITETTKTESKPEEVQVQIQKVDKESYISQTAQTSQESTIIPQIIEAEPENVEDTVNEDVVHAEDVVIDKENPLNAQEEPENIESALKPFVTADASTEDPEVISKNSKTSFWSRITSFGLGVIGLNGALHLKNSNSISARENLMHTLKEFNDSQVKENIVSGIKNTCPIADRYSGWKVMHVLHHYITECVTHLTEQAKTSGYDRAWARCNPKRPTFEYGIANGLYCKRRERGAEEGAGSGWWDQLKENESKDGFVFDRYPGDSNKDPLILKCQQHEATLTCTGARDYSEVYSVTETSEGIEERLCLKENECLNSNDGSLLKKYIDPNYKVVEANQESSPLWQKYAVLAGGAVLSIACTYKAYQSFQAFRREFSSETGTVARKALYATNTALWLVNAGVIAAAAVTFQREMSGQAVL